MSSRKLDVVIVVVVTAISNTTTIATRTPGNGAAGWFRLLIPPLFLRDNIILLFGCCVLIELFGEF